MWKGLVRAPQGRLSLRKFTMLSATLLVVCFTYILAASPASYAADHDANWNGGNLSYDARDYTGPKTAEKNDKSTLAEGTIYYAAYENGNARTGSQAQGYIIYFEKGTDPAKATSAYYTFGFFDIASGKFSNLSPPKKIDVDASTYGDAATIEPSSCDVSGIGWMICPVSNWIAEGMDYLYNIVAAYLRVSPITGTDSGLYEMWSVIRNVANICFIIGFLVLIYAQITGGVISNYTIKKMLPRIIIAAVLVNVSYWICAIAVDLSNILGASVQNMFMAMQERIGAANSGADDIGWVKVTSLALGGGSLATIGILGATAGGAGALTFAIIGALIPALFAVFVAVIILAARQALITVLIVLSPLAFVAYLLPNTEDWFKRWRKLFTALMVMFPAFAVIFGGAQLTGVLIIQNASTLPVVILGLLVQVIPLFITPFLIKLSSGLMGTIAGMANDRSKGVFDRARNWAGENRDMHKARALRNGMNRRKNLSLKKGERLRTARALARPTTAGAYFASGKMHRDRMTAAYNAQAEGSYGDTRRGRRSYTEDKIGELNKSLSHANNEELWQGRVGGQIKSTRRTQWGRNREDERYHGYEKMTHDAHKAEGRAELYKNKTQAEGEKEFREEIEASRALTRVVKDTYHAKKQAEQFEAIVQKAAEKSWNNRIRHDDEVRSRQLKVVRNEDNAKLAEQQVTTLIQEVRTQGGEHSIVTTPDDMAVANAIQHAHIEHDVSSQAAKAAERLQTYQMASEYRDNSTLRVRAAGIGGEKAANLVYAQAFSTMVEVWNKDVSAEKTTLSRVENGVLLDRLDDTDLSAESLAATAGVIAGRKHRASQIKLFEKLRILHNDAVASGDVERQAVIKDIQQQVDGDKSAIPFGLSAGDQDALGRGEYSANIMSRTRERILSNLSPESMSTLDPDELQLMYEMYTGGFLQPEHIQKIASTWDDWQADDQLKGKIQDKHRNFLERIKTGDHTTPINGLTPPPAVYDLTNNSFI